MDTQQIIAHRVTLLAAFTAAVMLCRVIYILYFAPLREVPGPFLARFTRAWQYFHLRNRGDAPAILIRLHQKHGIHDTDPSVGSQG
jgi:hypothetical protein